MSDMPERIWAEVSPNSGDEWWTAEPSDLGKAMQRARAKEAQEGRK